MSKMTFRHIPSFLILAGLLCACSQDEPTDSAQSSVGQPLVLTVGFPTATRATVDNYWDGGETVYVQIMDNYEGTADWTNVPVLEYTVGADGKRLNLQSETNLPVWGVNEKQKLIRAWYSGEVAIWQNRDYVSYSITNLNNPVTWYVSGNQNYTFNFGNASMPPYEGSDFVFAQTIAKPDQREVPLTFYHQVAKVMINVKNDLPGSNTIAGAAIANHAYGSGRFTPPELGNNYGGWTPTGYSGSINMRTFSATDVLVDFGDGQAVTPNARYGCLVIPQPTVVNNSYVRFYVDVSGDFDEYFYYTLTQSNNWNPGRIYSYNLTLKPTGLKLSSIDVSIGWDTTGATGTGETVL